LEEKINLIETSKTCNNATLYVYFNNVDKIVNHLYEIQKLEYVQKNVLVDDKIADKEIQNLIAYEKDILNKEINQNIENYELAA
jgi:hypothetical protein